jgi:hypothetical protein
VNTDEILRDPLAALALPDGAIPLHVIVLAEYAEPGSDNMPAVNRLATVSDDDLTLWTSVGILRFAQQLELNDVADRREEDD